MGRNNNQLIVRNAVKEDIVSVQNIVSACDIDEFGTDEFVINMKEVFDNIPFEENTWVAYYEDKKIVGHAFLEEMGEGRLDGYVFTHPEYKGMGVATLLVESVENRAKEYIRRL